MLEPLNGGRTEIHGSGGGQYSGINGLGYGGRISYQKLGFSVAADYIHSNLDIDKALAAFLLAEKSRAIKN